MTSQHIGINDNLEDNKKAVVERCKNSQSKSLLKSSILHTHPRLSNIFKIKRLHKNLRHRNPHQSVQGGDI